MSMDQKILVKKSDYINLHKSIHVLQRQVLKLQSTIKLIKAQNAKYVEWKNNFLDYINKKQKEMDFGDEFKDNNKILLDLLQNEHVEYPFFIPETLSLSNELYSMCPKAYDIICK